MASSSLKTLPPYQQQPQSLYRALAVLMFGDVAHAGLLEDVVAAQRLKFDYHYLALGMHSQTSTKSPRIRGKGVVTFL